MDPQLIVLDEPVSALDVSIQAQVVNLLDDLQDDLGLSYVFIAHDLSVVRHVSDQIAVMYLGKLMELSPARELYTKPMHPYTEALLEAIPIPDPEENSRRERNVIGGEPPNPINPPIGLPLPHPLPARHRDLQRRRAAAGRVRGRPCHGVPPSAERHRGGGLGRHALAAEPAERRRGDAVSQRSRASAPSAPGAGTESRRTAAREADDGGPSA